MKLHVLLLVNIVLVISNSWSEASADVAARTALRGLSNGKQLGKTCGEDEVMVQSGKSSEFHCVKRCKEGATNTKNCWTPAPTSSPTSTPSTAPSMNPSGSPSQQPSSSPSSAPSSIPSVNPSSKPTESSSKPMDPVVAIEQIDEVYSLQSLNPDFSYHIEFSKFRSGYNVYPAGDVNGDGLQDVIVSRPQAATPDSTVYESGGDYFVIFGKAGKEQEWDMAAAGIGYNLESLDGTNGFAVRPRNINSMMGSEIAAMDFNNDGYSDLLISEHAVNGGGDNYHIGLAHVLFGSPTIGQTAIDLNRLDGVNGFSLQLGTVLSHNYLGVALASVGDVNGDSIDDIIIGSLHKLTWSNIPGQSYVLFGGNPALYQTGLVDLSRLDGTHGFAIQGLSALGTTGRVLAQRIDLNSDGINDLVLSSTTIWDALVPDFTTYVVYGAADIANGGSSFDLNSLDGRNGFRIDGLNRIPREYGRTLQLGSVGDVNGDSIDDLLIATSGDTSYLIYGTPQGQPLPPSMNVLTDLTGANGFTLHHDEFRFASVPNTPMDLNRDGRNDVVIGNPYGSEVHVLFGRSSDFEVEVDLKAADGVTGFKLVSFRGGMFGLHMCAADLNNDSQPDLLLSSQFGQVYVWEG